MPPFRIPNPEQFLPQISEAPLSLGASSTGIDQAGLEQILRTLEVARPPEVRPIGAFQGILGRLGDALLAAAAIRAGGQPPSIGPFASRVQNQQLSQQQEAAAAEESNRALRNRVRIGAFEESQRAARESANIKARGSGRPLRFISRSEMRGDTVINTTDVYDPITGEYLGTHEGGERGFAPFIQPAIAGESPPQRIPRQGPSGPIGRIPPAPSTEAEAAGKLAGFSKNLAQFKAQLPGFIERNKTLGGRRIGQQVARRVPIIGAQISERISKEGELTAAARDAVMADFTRIMSGLQASELEQARLARILPDLGTVDSATALAKIAQFENSVRAFAQERFRTRPNLLSPELIEELGLNAPAAAGETADDPAVELFREMFGREPEQ